jgi:hypothetical protein
MERSGGSTRWRPRQREGRRWLRLALGAAGQDEGGEGGSKMENGGGLRGSHRGGGGDGDGGQKHTSEGCGGLVPGVDERWFAWPCVEESEQGKKKRRARRGGRPF